MGTPAIPSAADRLEAVRLADLVLSQIEADEDLPVIGDNRAWLLAAEIVELRDEAEDNERTWREALEALQAKQLELEAGLKKKVRERDIEADRAVAAEKRAADLAADTWVIARDRDVAVDRAIAAEGKVVDLQALLTSARAGAATFLTALKAAHDEAGTRLIAIVTSLLNNGLTDAMLQTAIKAASEIAAKEVPGGG